MSWPHGKEDALTATDAEVLALLKEAAGVTQSRATPERLRKWTITNALKVSVSNPSRDYDRSWERLEQVYDTNIAAVEAVPLVEDSDQWTEVQKWMRR